MSEDIDSLKLMLGKANAMCSEMRMHVLRVSSAAKTSSYTKEELCDLGFLCREIRTAYEEIRKDINATKALVDKIMCIKSMSEMLTNQSGEDKVDGKLASGRPHYKKSVSLPKTDSPEYWEMLNYFGVTEIGRDLGVAKVSWKKVTEYVTELAELGKPIPKFFPQVFDDYTVIHRRK